MTDLDLEEDISALKQEMAAIKIAISSFRKFPVESERQNYLLDTRILEQHPDLEFIYDTTKSQLKKDFNIKEKRLAVLESQRRPNFAYEGKLTNLFE